jgi:hypothetical protein
MSDDFEDRRPPVPNGGRPHDGPAGSIHLSFRSGSRASGASAAAAFAYITRTEEFAERDLDEALYTDSGNMPDWAEDKPEEYWEAADLYERANGRLYLSVDFALPRGLDLDEQIEMAEAFVVELTEEECLPHTLAIHAGRDEDGQEHNPHAHVLISERMNDGIARDREQWFRRANRDQPARGGAPKSRAFHGRPWMERARSRWAERTNEVLAKHGRYERVDHRSFARQGFDREPGRHLGPAAAYMVAKGMAHDAVERSAGAEVEREQLRALDSSIEALERERSSLVEREDRATAQAAGGTGGTTSAKERTGQDDDLMRGR